MVCVYLLSDDLLLPAVNRGPLHHERGADTPRRLCKQIAPVSRARLSSPKRKSLFPPFLRKTDRENRNFQGPAQPPWNRWGVPPYETNRLTFGGGKFVVTWSWKMPWPRWWQRFATRPMSEI